jgi:hypothetical protein
MNPTTSRSNRTPGVASGARMAYSVEVALALAKTVISQQERIEELERRLKQTTKEK